ncbi:MAG TPA: DUF4214 domain-containing protein, partial [Pyrinomonadaceae bacterium]|nr:DUF4214 domain-containing protein [Pyrinomonadaceae bacterium]
LTVQLTSDDEPPRFSPLRDGSFDPAFFVRAHYRDFFSRDPDAAGLAFWQGQLDECGTDASCLDLRKVHVSAAFFLSIEFQETGFLVYRLHQAAFDTGERLSLRAFLSDAQEIGRGVVVGQGDWQAQLDANKRAFVEAFAARPAFLAGYPQTLTAEQFVTALNANTGNSLTIAETADLATRLSARLLTRADVLRAVAEHAEFSRRHKNRAFVMMQYFGYMRREPDAAGFQFWLGKLDNHNGDFVSAEMVRSFLVSGEYIGRFGQP